MNIVYTLCVSPVTQPEIPANRFNTFIYPSPTYILKLITSTKCASSLDHIPIQLLLLLTPKLNNKIIRIITEFLQSGIVPDSMKIDMKENFFKMSHYLIIIDRFRTLQLYPRHLNVLLHLSLLHISQNMTSLTNSKVPILLTSQLRPPKYIYLVIFICHHRIMMVLF